jgi:hypothetical protein
MPGQHRVGQFRLGAAEIAALALLAVPMRSQADDDHHDLQRRGEQPCGVFEEQACSSLPGEAGLEGGIPVRGRRLIHMPTDNSEAILSRGPKSVPIQRPIRALREAREGISPWTGGQNQAEKPIDLIDVCHKLRSCGHIWPRHRSRTGCPSTRFRFHFPPAGTDAALGPNRTRQELACAKRLSGAHRQASASAKSPARTLNNGVCSHDYRAAVTRSAKTTMSST